MAAGSQNVSKLYKSVIDDVINNVREAFLDEGVEEPVLQDLKQIWESKLLQSRAIDLGPRPQQQQQQQQSGGKFSVQDASASYQSTGQERQQNKQSSQPPLDRQGASAAQAPLAGNLSSSAAAANLAVQQNMLHLQPQQMQSVPFAIQQQGSGAGATQTFPAYQLQTQQPSGMVGLQSIPVLIQPGVQSTGQEPHIVTTPQGMVLSQGAIRVQSSGDQPPIVQVDGTNDTSDEEDDDFDEDDDDDKDDDDDNDDNDNEDAGGDDEEEPLNSADDVSDEDPSELFEADNVVVCQYDKINRSRNKWKFTLKHGIMNLKGKDYVFCKSTGDADW
ncbi:transcription initiation factor IIA subunit 1-like [Diadema setosum]|uniref:transcription initiation factor IIA subunit 1-like n=1 Tax=Diadema setosum TaxID=31175 RepID=UPI003B3B29B0